MTRKCNEEIEKISKTKTLKGTTPYTMKELKTFKYEIGMTEEEMTERVLEMIAYMRTDEYWLERSGNSPYYLEGGELMQKYLETTDGKKDREKRHSNCAI